MIETMTPGNDDGQPVTPLQHLRAAQRVLETMPSVDDDFDLHTRMILITLREMESFLSD
jgi:hypothetical protein